MTSPYRTYSDYLRERFNEPVRTVTINSGYTCPNRDGSKGRHGCTYCNLKTLEPSYVSSCSSITDQIKKGVAFHQARYTVKKYLAYFQSYSNTYATIDQLNRDYAEALAFPGVHGLVIATRPDCIDEDILDYLSELSARHYVAVEIGVESTNDETLTRVNRCHTFADTTLAIHRLKERNIPVGAHLILGFPWEDADEITLHADRLSALPITFLKLHHLQIHKGTVLAHQYKHSPFRMISFDNYSEVVIDFIARSRPDIVFQRLISEAPARFLVAPHWQGIRNAQFMELIRHEMIHRGVYQGMVYAGSGACPA